MTKFYQQPFAASGDTGTPIPEAIQITGSVSYAQGFGPDYSREQGVDPLAKDVPREETNQLFKDITDNLAFWQRQGAPEWVTSAQNGGVPLVYGAGAIVRYRADPGDPYLTYVSRTAANIDLPTVATSWTLFNYQFALNADTTSTNIPVDPAYVTARLAGVTVSVPPASETVAGISEYATDLETIGGSPANRTVTPPGLAAAALAGGWATPFATISVFGKVRLANPAAVSFASATDVASPAWVGAAIPPATTAVIGRARLATPTETTNQVTGAGGPAAVPPEALTGYARLGQNVSFTLVQSSGGFDVTSSERVKRDLRDNPYGLDAVLAIETAVGRYRADYLDDPREHVFLLAEQLANVVPLAVRDNGAEYNGDLVPTVNYDMMVPVLVRAIQDLNDRLVATWCIGAGLGFLAAAVWIVGG